MPPRRNSLLTAIAHAHAKPGSTTRKLVKIVFLVPASFLAAYLGWSLIGHNVFAIAVPFLACLFAGSFWIAWRDVYGYRPGWFWLQDSRWLEQRRSSRVVESLYEDRDDN